MTVAIIDRDTITEWRVIQVLLNTNLTQLLLRLFHTCDNNGKQQETQVALINICFIHDDYTRRHLCYNALNAWSDTGTLDSVIAAERQE